MARSEIPYVVIDLEGNAISGATILVTVRGGGTATVYTAETGGTTKPNPLTSTPEGRIDGWLDEGAYNVAVSGAGITSYAQAFEVVSGHGTALIADGAVTTPKLADDAVTGPKANLATLYASGLLASRPVVGEPLRHYNATDTGEIFLDTGSAWLRIGRTFSTGTGTSGLMNVNAEGISTVDITVTHNLGRTPAQIAIELGTVELYPYAGDFVTPAWGIVSRNSTNFVARLTAPYRAGNAGIAYRWKAE